MNLLQQQDSDSSLEDLRFRTATSSSVVELTFDSKRGNKMGNNQSERSESNGAKYIISEEPPVVNIILVWVQYTYRSV